ncbi:MAG: SPOR domain-containing protein [Gammaproteobacteria bacterium]|nr:SPOR domain-containing protein [Gammaproteobacteria bacterium]
MKNKDYVSQPKRSNNRKKANSEQRKPFPIVKFSIVFVLVAAFAYFLTFLGNDQQQTTSEQTKSPVSTKPEQQLPPPPEDEEWQFIDELKNKQVDVGTEELEDKGPFVLRCTTVRSQSRAEALKAKIAFAGHESTVKPHQGTSGMWYRVDLGPYEKKREAEKVRHDMKRNSINGCKILLWR